VVGRRSIPTRPSAPPAELGTGLGARRTGALLGYLKVLESSQPTMESVARLQDAIAFPERAFRCMRHHAEADLDHSAEIDEVIDLACARDPRLYQPIARNCLQTCELLFDTLVSTYAWVCGAVARFEERYGEEFEDRAPALLQCLRGAIDRHPESGRLWTPQLTRLLACESQPQLDPVAAATAVLGAARVAPDQSRAEGTPASGTSWRLSASVYG
jgi:hypothetical protein